MTETKGFEKVRKQFALNNSYFKNTPYGAPQNPTEVLEYFQQHGELPFRIGNDVAYWLYDCYVEWQKRRGVYRSQFFTPPATAGQLAEIANGHFEDKDSFVLDACCGFGMLSKALLNFGYNSEGFDIDSTFKPLYSYFAGGDFNTADFRDYQPEKYRKIVANPPYEVKECTEFLESLYSWLDAEGIAVLLLPKGFVDKERPKRLVTVLSKFSVLYREDAIEPFARTNVRAEIVVLSKVNTWRD